jgi:carbon-monoxide dehydrogenase small subunit
MSKISMKINGRTVSADVDERMLLIEFIRDVGLLTGTHAGCYEARCGCCAVEMNGATVKSCNVLALQAEDAEILTVEALSTQRVAPISHITTQTLASVYKPLDAKASHLADLHPLQTAFHECHALQCGFCTPGMLMVLKGFLEENPNPSRGEVREAISGNLCRCTGYQHIVDAAMRAAAVMRGETVDDIIHETA